MTLLDKLEVEAERHYGRGTAVEIGRERAGWFGKLWRADGTEICKVTSMGKTAVVASLREYIRHDYTAE